MPNDELRGKTCQSVLENNRVCGKPAVVKEWGCFFCAEHATSTEDSDITDTAVPTDEAPALTPKSETLEQETAHTEPKPKGPVPKPAGEVETQIPADKTPPKTEHELSAESTAPPAEKTPVEAANAPPKTVQEPVAAEKPKPAPKDEAAPKPQASKESAKPKPEKKQEKPAVVVKASPPAQAAPVADNGGEGGFQEFSAAVQNRLEQGDLDDPNKSQLSVLSDVQDDLVDLAARSFHVWSKLNSLFPDKEQMEYAQFEVKRYHIDLWSKQIRQEFVPCADLEDVVGGMARGYKILEERPMNDAYDPAALLVMNLGLLSGTQFMTGLRTYFHAYSPLKASKNNRPSAMWTAGSGKFGTKLRYLDVDEVIFQGACSGPTLLHITREGEDGPPVFKFLDASFLAGRRVNDKIQALYRRYPEAHFAVIGPAGEEFKNVRYAAIALSTENQLKSGDAKPRFCGRGGIGGVMGSKNLLAIVADVKDPPMAKAPPEMKKINVEVARGKGSSRFRDKKKANGGGGTWSNYEALHPVRAMPEMNFVPIGDDRSEVLYRDNVEKENYIVKDEACYRCGIACHKNVYNQGRDGKPGRFRAKLDFEPLNLLSSNIGIFDIDDACELVALVDEMGMDSISCAVTISYAMEYNKRHEGNGNPLADGVAYGDFEGARRAIENIGLGRMPDLGQGVKRLSESLGETDYAIHVKGMELPAYLPQTNPGYAWALAGGHMSMRTYLLYLYEREDGMDYWVDAIVNRGIHILRDDFLGVCKFAGLDDEMMCQAIKALTGLDLDPPRLQRLIRRTFLRGYRLERRQGFTEEDYVLPKMAHEQYDQIQLPYFNSQEFFDELKGRVLQSLDQALVEEGLEV